MGPRRRLTRRRWRSPFSSCGDNVSSGVASGRAVVFGYPPQRPVSTRAVGTTAADRYHGGRLPYVVRGPIAASTREPRPLAYDGLSGTPLGRVPVDRRAGAFSGATTRSPVTPDCRCCRRKHTTASVCDQSAGFDRPPLARQRWAVSLSSVGGPSVKGDRRRRSFRTARSFG